jgi:hypothetical protein
MAPADRRPAFSARKERRPHPASPQAAARGESRGGDASPDGEKASGLPGTGTLSMFALGV